MAAKSSSGTRDPQQDKHQVLAFRPPNAGNRLRAGSSRQVPGHPPAPIKGLEEYEAGEAEESYGHRMMVNFAALLATVLLSLAGVWLAIHIADLRKNQDCALSGRRNCMPIEIKEMAR